MAARALLLVALVVVALTPGQGHKHPPPAHKHRPSPPPHHPPPPPPSPPSPPPPPCACGRPEDLLPPVYADPCIIGPSYWCAPTNDSSSLLSQCNLDWVANVSSCQYSSGICPNVGSLTNLCAGKYAPNVTGPAYDPFAYPGGVIGMPAGYTGLYAFALFWAPSSCYPNSNPSPGGFCSNYTYAGTVGGKTLQLHGLWPDFGNLYGTYGTPAPPSPPTYPGAYQGWSQYCTPLAGRAGLQPDYSKCHVNGGLCPYAATSQSSYEFCMRANNITDCIIPESYIQNFANDFATYAAAYLGADRTFVDHEWNKHGSCMPGIYSHDIQAYWTMELAQAKRMKNPSYWGSAAVLYVEANRGKAVPVGELTKRLNSTGVPRCTSASASPWKTACMLSEIWYCASRDMAGNLVDLIPCPPGSLVSDSCTGACANVIIPDFEVGPYIVPPPASPPPSR